MNKSSDYKRVFDHFDEDGNGMISPSELQRRVGLIWDEEVLLEEVQVVVESLQGSNGQLGFEDFVSLMDSEKEGEKLEDLRKAFRMYEMDGTDYITPKSLNRMLNRLGQALKILSWSTRLRITKGTARGLAYLHECSPRKFVHGDIKPSNILPDNEYQPYILDFGFNGLVNITGNKLSSSGGFMGGRLPYLKSTQPQKVNNYRAPEARVSTNRPTQK